MGRRGFLLSAAGLPWAWLGAAPSAARFEFEQRQMGTLARIVLYAPDEATARRVADAGFARIAQLDAALSDYRESSELSRLCRQAGGPPVQVSGDLFRVLELAQEIARRSNGAFDVTAGPLVRLWRRARRRHELPAPDDVAAARALVGYRLLRLDEQQRAVRLEKPGMQLDLGGIAKGFAAGEALGVLAARGVRAALVAIGGDIAAGDAPPGSRGWVVGVARLEDAPPASGEKFPAPSGSPFWSAGACSRFGWAGARSGPGPQQAAARESGSKLPHSKKSAPLLLRNAAVSTSGDGEQHLEIGGVRYSHIVDPRSGTAVQGRSSVTVVVHAQNSSGLTAYGGIGIPACLQVANEQDRQECLSYGDRQECLSNGALADALATAASVLGPSGGLRVVDSFPLAAALFSQESGGRIRVFPSRRWGAIVKTSPDNSPSEPQRPR